MELRRQAPTLPARSFGSIAPVVPVSGLMTPPDSPTDTFTTGDEHVSGSEKCHSVNNSSILMEGGIVYPVDEIRAMAEELAHARDRREFPHTSASPRDARVVVEDYENLMKLRQARGNPSEHASEEYKQLLVEVTRHIKERDAALDEKASKMEATRRVDCYLRSVEQEQQYFDATKALAQQRVARPTDLDDVGEEIFSIIEKAAEQTIADATSPLRLNIGNLRNETADLRDQNDVFSRQIDLHYHVLEQQSASISALHAMFGPQAKNIQATTEQLAQAGSLVGSLSQIVMNLPDAVNQVVHTAVQQQTQDAFRDILEAQQKIIIDLEKRSRQIQAMALEVEASRLQLEKQKRDLGSVHLSGSKSQELGVARSRGKVRSAMKKVFRNN